MTEFQLFQAGFWQIPDFEHPLIQLADKIDWPRFDATFADSYSEDLGAPAKAVREAFRLTPRGMSESLDLRKPIYRETARHGHFGRSLPTFTWEKTDKAEALKKACGA